MEGCSIIDDLLAEGKITEAQAAEAREQQAAACPPRTVSVPPGRLAYHASMIVAADWSNWANEA